MATAVANTEAREYWTARAAGWLEDQDALEIFGGAPGEAAIEALAPQPGERILDIGCGGGATSLALAGRVAPRGSVVGVDISPGMVAGAQARAAASGAGSVSFVVGDAQVEDLGAGAFQAAYSRFGVMFFADPVAAFANIHRCLAPAGRLSFCCWQGPASNEWMTLPTVVARGVLGMAPPQPDPGEPGPFSFADPGRIREILEGAGFQDVDVALHNDTVALSEGDVATRARVALRQGLVAELLKEVSDETRDQVVAALQEAMRSRMVGGVSDFSRGYLVVTARA
ncbi:MAG TPA: methyltransferase domain-containing protein [Actinomycetota bacterium]|nr:methyltransferase domain-containing protein [Actinomycetota bacterium]